MCGAEPLVEHVRTELYATGARPRGEALAGVGALTASERRVADLAADGRTNRDIAQTLFVTPKTVEVHLERRVPQARDPLAPRARGRARLSTPNLGGGVWGLPRCAGPAQVASSRP